MTAGGKGEPAAAQPVEQNDGGAHPLADHIELTVGGWGAAVALPEPSQHVPDRVAVQQLFVFGVAALVDGLGDPPLDPCELLVAGW